MQGCGQVHPISFLKNFMKGCKFWENQAYTAQEGLQLLFHCEYLALVEYIECVVPLVFVVYKSILQQLPNVVYYPGGAGSWGVTAVTNLLVFAVLEVASLVLLHVFLQRTFAFSPLYQLAFVLETQVYPVQANLVLEAIFLLQALHIHVVFTWQHAQC
ncbi:hypothetical protein GQ600_11070 [Phytophthora cactorum]|nr:hypothetical protein GQ600_11070 [Phytophthora cactorum]